MENKETEVIEENSGHVLKLGHQFYFVKHCPTEPNSISKIKKEEKVVTKINQEICEMIENITKKTSKIKYLDSELKHLINPEAAGRDSAERNEKILRDLYMALDELNLNINGGWLGQKLDKNSLNYLKLHGSKSLADEKKILKGIKIQQKDAASFDSLEVLKQTLSGNGGNIFFLRFKTLQPIKRNYYLSDLQKLYIKIEEFQIQYMKRISSNDIEKGNISYYESLKKTIEGQIKRLCDESLEIRGAWKKCVTRIRHGVKEKDAINEELYTLRAKLNEKHMKKDEAYKRILKLKKLYHDEILNYDKHCSLMNKVHQLVEEKDVADIDKMSSSHIEKFMLEWNNNKAFRENYEKKVLKSFERRCLTIYGRRISDKSCSFML